MGRIVSNSFKQLMSKDILPFTHFRATFGIEAPNARGESAVTTPQEALWSDATKIKDLITPTSNYASCELNTYILGNNKTLLPNNPESYIKDKFTSANISDINCEYPSNAYPTINVQFTNLQNIAGLTFLFDINNKNYPSEMVITGLDGNTVKKTVTCYPTSYEYISEDFEQIRALKIEIKKSNLPYLRAIISSLYFGVTKYFTETTSTQVEQTFSLSPINNNLYKSEFKISLDNFDLQYNVDNKSGIYTYLTEQQPIKIEYSLDNLEWIECGNYLTSGKAKISGNIATIESIDQIQYMNDKYKKDVYRTSEISLHQLAQNVLSDFGWELNERGEYPYEISNSLQSKMTKGTLPVSTYAECLQLIASAGGVTLYTDDRGYVCLKPLPNSVSDSDYIIDFNNASNYPEPEEIEPLAQVDVTVHSYATESESSEISKSTYTLSGTTTLQIDYDFSTNQSAVIPSGVTLNSANYYARYCELNVTGTGDYEIKINGTKIVDNTSIVSVINQENGEIAPLDNPLITNTNIANAVGANAKNYLGKRIRYTIPWVQDYRIKVGDLIYIKTQFSNKVLCRVIELKTSEPAMIGYIKVVVMNVIE